MTHIKLGRMKAGQLVERFVTIALEQDSALLTDEYMKFNRLYEEREAVEQELKARAGDQRHKLLGLLEHPNAQVRLNAAIATLALAPQAARQTLQLIKD